MKQMKVALTVFVVLVSILLTLGLSWAQNPPTLLVIVRANDDSLWKMTCDEVACSPFASFPGMFGYQPTVTWDETAQEWVIVGTASNNTIWMATFNKQGNFNNDWQSIPGSTPSPAGVAGGTPRGVTRTVNCPSQSLQTAINAANPGDVINVTGTCNENVNIWYRMHSLTLDGQNVATINGNSSSATLLVMGRGILIQNFTITGGHNGVQVQRGSFANINNNNITNTGGYGGIVVNQSSFSLIRNNNIHTNLRDGILVDETSSARIGWSGINDASPSPNTIQNNGGRGITVAKGSTAWIVSNTIANNTGDGIGVFKLSQASTASNIINGNNGNGINVGLNSGIDLGESAPRTFFSPPNITTVNNTQYGINCYMGGYVRGHLGSTNQINGTAGQTNIANSCLQDLFTP